MSHIREIRNTDAHRACDPILLVHGAHVPGIASFDLPVPGGSLAADLAERVACVYVIDIRGYSQSTRPLEMEEPPQNHPPIVLRFRQLHQVILIAGPVNCDGQDHTPDSRKL